MARKPRIIQPPKRRKRLFKRDSASVPGALLPRRGFWYWYGRQISQHPLRTISGGVLLLVLVGGLITGGIWYTRRHADATTWADAPDAAVNTVPPYAKWQDTPWNTYGETAIQVTQDGSRKALRFIGPANAYKEGDGARSQRAELVPRLPDITPGQEVWVGMSIKLNADLGTAQDFQTIFQVKNDTEGSPTLTLAANGGEAGLDLRRNTGPAGSDTAKQALGALPTTDYSRIVIGMKMTRSPSSSWVEAWRDGQPLLLRSNWDSYNQAGNGQSGGLMYADAASAYLKFGLYRAPQTWPMDLRMTDIKIAADRDAVK